MKHLPPLDDMPQTGSRRVMPPPTPAMVNVRAYWQGLCRGQPVPFRSQIDPAQITSVLDRAFVLERRRSELARFRVAGSQLCTAMGMDLRGMPMISLFDPSERRRCSDWLDHILSQPATGEMTLTAGDAAVQARMLVLPLRSDMGQIDRMLGCLEITSNAIEHPGLYRIGDLATTPIPRPPRADVAEETRAPCPEGFADPAARFAARSGRNRPAYLRVVK
jgi:hypothetical protein